MNRLSILFLIQLVLSSTEAFSNNGGAQKVLISSSAALLESKSTSTQSKATTTTKISAATDASALTEYMVKSHEEKLRAVAEVDKKYKAKIEELEMKLSQYENAEIHQKSANTSSADNNSSSKTTSATVTVFSDGDAYYPAATNKEMALKLRSYQDFLSKYIVESQIEKIDAVKSAEEKLKQQYGQIIDSLQKDPNAKNEGGAYE